MSLKGKSSKNVLGRGRVAKGVRPEVRVSLDREAVLLERNAPRHPTVFQMRVYDCIREKVPKGYVTSYGVVAKALKSSPRAVGQALRVNPYAPDVPCHRVIKNDKTIGGFQGCMQGAHGGGNRWHAVIARKIALLKQEGVIFDSHGRLLETQSTGGFLHSLEPRC